MKQESNSEYVGYKNIFILALRLQKTKFVHWINHSGNGGCIFPSRYLIFLKLYSTSKINNKSR